MRNSKIVLGSLMAMSLVALLLVGWAPQRSALTRAWHIIQKKQFVDLTHSFEPGIPVTV